MLGHTIMQTYFGRDIPEATVFFTCEIERAEYDALPLGQRQARLDREKSHAVGQCVRQMQFAGDTRSSLEILQQSEVVWRNASDIYGDGVFYVWACALLPKGRAR